MSGEAKTVSELCREALELANKAEADKGKHTWDSYQRAYGNHFFNFAFQNIKQIAERCLELESENQKLREALQYIFQEIENIDPDNRSKRDQDFHAHIMGFWIEDEALKQLGEL